MRIGVLRKLCPRGVGSVLTAPIERLVIWLRGTERRPREVNVPFNSAALAGCLPAQPRSGRSAACECQIFRPGSEAAAFFGCTNVSDFKVRRCYAPSAIES